MITEKVLRGQATATQGAVCVSGPQMIAMLNELAALRESASHQFQLGWDAGFKDAVAASPKA